MSVAAYDSVTDESGLFRMIHGQDFQQQSRTIRRHRQPRPGLRRKTLLWLTVAAALAAVILWQPWKLRSSQVAPRSEVKAPAR